MELSSSGFYNQHATTLADQYLSKTFAEVHRSWLHLLTPILNKPNARILDLGAGAGRDSRYLAEQGQANHIDVTAIEPADSLADIGRAQTQGLNVSWLNDSLPALENVTAQEISFDLILLSAVWMHIPASLRARSLRKLANLLKPGGKLVISLRHGKSTDARVMHEVCSDELTNLGKTVGLFPIFTTDTEHDRLGRSEVHWQTVVLQLPDCLVALYWCHQYKILIDHNNLFQTPNKKF